MKLITMLMLLTLMGCSHKSLMKGSTSHFNEKNGIEGKIMWIKNKRRKIDVKLSLRNNYGFPVVIQQNAVSAIYNEQKNSGADHPNTQMILREGDVLNSVITLNFDDPVGFAGDGTIIIRHMYKFDADKGQQIEKLKDLEMPFTSQSRSATRR